MPNIDKEPKDKKFYNFLHYHKVLGDGGYPDLP